MPVNDNFSKVRAVHALDTVPLSAAEAAADLQTELDDLLDEARQELIQLTLFAMSGADSAEDEAEVDRMSRAIFAVLDKISSPREV